MDNKQQNVMNELKKDSPMNHFNESQNVADNEFSQAMIN